MPERLVLLENNLSNLFRNRLRVIVERLPLSFSMSMVGGCLLMALLKLLVQRGSRLVSLMVGKFALSAH